MKITIETIPQSEQRYDTAGDWTVERNVTLPHMPNHIRIRVSHLSSPERMMAVAVHELIEVLGCVLNGIEQSEVDRFDMAFEKARKDAGAHGSAEPGDDRRAPYYPHHQFASGIERLVAHEWGIDWDSYCDEIERLSK